MASRDGCAPAGRWLLGGRVRRRAVAVASRDGCGPAGRRSPDGRAWARVQRKPSAWDGERGAGAALALAIITTALLLAMLIVGAGTAAIAQARAASAADAAALAAADALSGFADGSPCGLAQAVATGSGARLSECRIDGLDATVTTTVPVGPWRASVTARAGPPR